MCHQNIGGILVVRLYQRGRGHALGNGRGRSHQPFPLEHAGRESRLGSPWKEYQTMCLAGLFTALDQHVHQEKSSQYHREDRQPKEEG